MAKVIDYDYIVEVSTADALKQAASDISSWYNWEIPWVNTYKINAETSIYNEQGWWGWDWIAWWSTDVKWTPAVWSISWSSGSISLPDWTSISVSSWSKSISSSTYLYVDTTTWTVYSTTHSYEAVWENKIMICAAFPNSWKLVSFKAFWCADQSSLTTGSSIASWTIVANNIASWTITANEIASGTITANEIASNTITASEMNVSKLSAISANLWNITAWTITGTTITAGSTSWSAIVLNPDYNRIDIYYWWDVVWQIYWWSNDWYEWIVLNADSVIMTGRDIMDLNNAKLRIPVWDNLY